jgi:mannose-6-phosphate isomerase-like protein (cupin superfamily)
MIEVIGDAPDRRVELLCDDDALHATWTRFGPGRDGADLHVHYEHTDLFFVLAGEFTARLGPDGDERVLREGTLVEIPSPVVHGFRNAAAAELRFLNLHAPGAGFADYMRGLRDGTPVDFDQHDPPSDGGRSVDDVRVVTADASGEGEQVLAELDGLRISHVTLADEADHAASGWMYVLDGAVRVGDRPCDAGTWTAVQAGEPLQGAARLLKLSHR